MASIRHGVTPARRAGLRIVGRSPELAQPAPNAWHLLS
jgi:hypothetical protein